MFQLIVDSSPMQAGVAEPFSGPIIGYVVAAFVVITVVALVIHKIVRAFTRPELVGMNRVRILETWAEIEKTSEQGLMGAKLAVIEADKLLDAALKSMMMPGETLGERLKYAGYKYPDIKRVWPAHRLRNQLVHDSSFQISHRQAKGALADFQAALKTVNVL